MGSEMCIRDRLKAYIKRCTHMRMGMGEDQLMYIDKREIEKAEEWKNIFSEPVHLLGR